jgi:hypothetical protein
LKTWRQIATSGRQHLPVAHDDSPIAAFEAIASDNPVFPGFSTAAMARSRCAALPKMAISKFRGARTPTVQFEH